MNYLEIPELTSNKEENVKILELYLGEKNAFITSEELNKSMSEYRISEVKKQLLNKKREIINLQEGLIQEEEQLLSEEDNLKFATDYIDKHKEDIKTVESILQTAKEELLNESN